MTSVTANEAVLAVLGSVKELTEIRDPSGKVIGFFAPIAVEHAQHYANAAARIDPAAIQRAKEEKGPGRTTAEVLQHLKSLEKT